MMFLTSAAGYFFRLNKSGRGRTQGSARDRHSPCDATHELPESSLMRREVWQCSLQNVLTRDCYEPVVPSGSAAVRADLAFHRPVPAAVDARPKWPPHAVAAENEHVHVQGGGLQVPLTVTLFPTCDPGMGSMMVSVTGFFGVAPPAALVDSSNVGVGVAARWAPADTGGAGTVDSGARNATTAASGAL